jgi:hypothetical protein
MSGSINDILWKMDRANSAEELLRRMCQPIEESPLPLKVHPAAAWKLLHDEKFKGVATDDLLELANAQVGGRQYQEDNKHKAVIDRACAIAVLRGAY